MISLQNYDASKKGHFDHAASLCKLVTLKKGKFSLLKFNQKWLFWNNYLQAGRNGLIDQ